MPTSEYVLNTPQQKCMNQRKLMDKARIKPSPHSANPSSGENSQDPSASLLVKQLSLPRATFELLDKN